MLAHLVILHLAAVCHPAFGLPVEQSSGLPVAFQGQNEESQVQTMVTQKWSWFHHSICAAAMPALMSTWSLDPMHEDKQMQNLERKLQERTDELERAREELERAREEIKAKDKELKDATTNAAQRNIFQYAIDFRKELLDFFIVRCINKGFFALFLSNRSSSAPGQPQCNEVRPTVVTMAVVIALWLFFTSPSILFSGINPTLLACFDQLAESVLTEVDSIFWMAGTRLAMHLDGRQGMSLAQAALYQFYIVCGAIFIGSWFCCDYDDTNDFCRIRMTLRPYGFMFQWVCLFVVIGVFQIAFKILPDDAKQHISARWCSG